MRKPCILCNFSSTATSFRRNFRGAIIAVAPSDSDSNVMHGRDARRMLMRKGVENPAGVRFQ